MQDLNKLLRCDSEDLPEHLLGVAIHINQDRNRPHSGIFIRYNRQNFIFHFTGEGQKVFLTPVVDNEWFFFKTLSDVKFYIPSVYAHFRRIKQKSKPEYFYFYGGSLFDSNGDYQGFENEPNYMTCVGFCLAALKPNLRNVDFLKFQDWPAGKLEGKPDDSVNKFFREKVAPNHPELTLDEFTANVRRITPLEYVTAGFSKKIPVEKVFTDENKDIVKETIRDLINDWQMKS